MTGVRGHVPVDKPLNGTVDIAGPEPISMDELVRRFLTATGDRRPVTADRNARYFGVEVNDKSLPPDAKPRTGKTHFADWLSSSNA